VRKALAIWTAALMLGLVACARAPEAEPRPAVPKAASSTGRQAMVVATIHKGHLLQERYPLGVLCQIISTYRPDLVMVEIRPEAFAAGHYEDGPFEMTAVAFCARHAGAVVAPIDWWLESDMSAEAPPQSPEDEKALNAELARLPEPAWPPFEVVNSRAELQRGLELVNAEARYLGGNGVWTRRQAWFHHRALEALERTHAKRALAFVGFNHAPELAAFLTAFAYQPVSPLSLGLSEPERFNQPMPDDVVAAWRDGTTRIRASMDAAQGVAKQRYAAKVAYFDVAVARAGKCCVREADLAPAH
jgi:hypothetical protein